MFGAMGTDRPWWKRVTMIGVVLMGVATALENAGIIPIGTTGAFNDILQKAGELLVITGVYRQVATK